MKGLTHFISGVAMGSFIPAAVRMANNKIDNSLILGLGGLFGIMPDTLDFQVGQFFSQADYDAVYADLVAGNIILKKDTDASGKELTLNDLGLSIVKAVLVE